MEESPIVPAADLPMFASVLIAAARIAPHAHVTPVLRSHALDALAGCELHFKCENLQRVGAFKFRGACNAVFALDDGHASRGVVTQSSGNHGAAIALACRLRGIAASVVVPQGAPAIKLAAIEGYGARVVRCEATMAARDATAAILLAETGATLIHPFDNADVIAGQGTAALELLRECDALDAVLAPVGGGGLLSGTAISAHAPGGGIEVWGAEPIGAADAHASLREDRCITDMTAQTVCDGLRGHLAPRTFAILRERANGILLVEDADIVHAMRLLWERLKVVVEPSGAVALAAVLQHRERFVGRRVGIILSGGNVDLDALPALFAMASSNRKT
ncbi:MAG: pyridoxal-phosphate dependent enzyme [Lysobacter sp.]|nr:pyridoxal-phosphate dependent enzyme [Lysobacter sp.]